MDILKHYGYVVSLFFYFVVVAYNLFILDL